MPFGVKNGPPTYQKVVMKAFKKIFGQLYENISR
jgi:hypothetical protein